MTQGEGSALPTRFKVRPNSINESCGTSATHGHWCVIEARLEGQGEGSEGKVVGDEAENAGTRNLGGKLEQLTS